MTSLGYQFLPPTNLGHVDEEIEPSIKTWTPQQKGQCGLWLTECKSVIHVQRRVRTEWNVDNLRHQILFTIRRELLTRTLASQTGKYPEVSVIEDTVDSDRDSFCSSPDKPIRQDINNTTFRSNMSLYT
ncbi:hypothetical protein TNCV_2592501 [Trichonephila clavipes]|nr:hypothetical protein TNCV_2592501 [Trichonephila clavipes]